MLEFFLNPVLRGPTIGSMFMCLSAGLIGCIVFLQRRSLVGEALSHAAYPGVVISVAIAAFFFPFSENGASLCILLGAFLSGILGQITINQLEKKLKINSDSALCFVLAIFFGVGVLVASRLQMTQPLWFRQIQVFLFGQAATMRDVHIALYGGLAIGVISAMISLFRYLEILHFDPDFAKALGMRRGVIHGITHLLLVFAIIVGMRSVGVVLMSAMLIAPAVAARQWAEKLSTFLIFSAFFGMISGFFGNFFSVWIPKWMGIPKLSLATGPMIVLSATSFALTSLLFAPKKGYVSRKGRITLFRVRCLQENILKSLYKGKECKINKFLNWLMEMQGWLEDTKLTKKGRKEAEKLIRLHRLWEVYLVHMGQGVERVHHSAEEMEHILTPEIERQLQHLLEHPTEDPHSQPIPKR